MESKKYLNDYDNNFTIKAPEEFNKEALTLLNKDKKYWTKETIPTQDENTAFLLKIVQQVKRLLVPPKKQLVYKPGIYILELIHTTLKDCCWFMPYAALYQAISDGSYGNVQNAIFQKNRLSMLDCGGSARGCDHCSNLIEVLYGLAAADKECVEKLFPYENGLSRTGHPIARSFTNLIMGLWYKDPDILKAGYDHAKKQVALKSTKKQDAAIAAYLMALADKDIDAAMQALSAVCKSISRCKTDSIIPYDKPMGQYFTPKLHGLVILACFILGKDCIPAILSFDGPHYCKEYIKYLLDNNFPKPSPYVNFTGELSIINYLIANSPNSYTCMEGRRPLVDVDRYKAEQDKIIAEEFNMEDYFKIYNR